MAWTKKSYQEMEKKIPSSTSILSASNLAFKVHTRLLRPKKPFLPLQLLIDL